MAGWITTGQELLCELATFAFKWAAEVEYGDFVWASWDLWAHHLLVLLGMHLALRGGPGYVPRRLARRTRCRQTRRTPPGVTARVLCALAGA